MSLVVVGFVSTSCENKSITSKLDDLDTLIQVCPDSVYAVLDSMDTQQMSRSQRMRHALLHADAQNKAYIDFTTDSVMLDVVDYYDKHGTPNEQMRAHYLLGCTYRDLNDVPIELQCFQEAVEKADTTSKDCDLYTLYAIYGQMADIYHSQYLPEEELRALENCEKVAILDEDTLSAISAYALKMRVFDMVNKPDSVLIISRQARDRYLRKVERGKAARVLSTPISIFIDQHKLNEAKELMDIYDKESEIYKSIKDYSKQGIMYLYDKGRYYLLTNKTDSAKLFFYQLLSENKKEPAFKGLLMAYQQLHQPDSMAMYAKLYAQANDSSFIGMNSETIEQMTAMYDYGRHKRKAEEAQQYVIRSHKVIFMMSIILLALIILSAILYMYFYLKRKSTSQKINSLQADIKHYTRIITDIQNNSDETVDSLNKLLEESKKELAKYKESQTLSAFFDSEIYSTFKKASRNGSYIISEAEWNNLEILFNNTFSTYSDFIHSGHSMSSPQLYVCMLIRMGFGETEMANVMDVDLKRISRIKAQINQKLFDTQSARTLVPNLKIYF